MTRTWLEVAVNGPWGKAVQPGIPVRVEDIVAEGTACAREGAAIVHVHAYDEASGRQRDDADLYSRISEGSEGFHFGFPPAEYALDAYLRLLADEAAGGPWMVAGLAVDSLKLAAAAVARGGHLRTGLEDAPFGSTRSNVQWVQAARREIEAAGGRLASAADVRRALDEE